MRCLTFFLTGVIVSVIKVTQLKVDIRPKIIIIGGLYYKIKRQSMITI